VTTAQVTAKIDGVAERSARWLRVSTNKKSNQQDEGQQIPDIERWETGHGYDVKETYTVHGGSAFKGNAKFDAEWARVLKDIANGVFTVLVVWKTDRIDRKLETYKRIREVVEAGGRIEFVTEPHLNDLSTMGGRVALKIQEEIAYGESEKKQHAAHRTLANHKATGAISTRPPFGYAVEGSKHGKYFVIVESLRSIVETIFAKCKAGDSLVTIAKWLDSEGIKTARGGKWSASALKNIINNTAYMGYIQNDDGKTIGTCPVIIDAATHRAANAALKTRPARGPILAENRPLCSQALNCPHCGINSPMHRISCKVGPVLADGSRAKADYYRCAGRGAQRKGCGNMVRLTLVDAAVNYLMGNTDIPIMKREYVPGHNHDAEIADVDYRISQLSPEGLTRAEYQEKLNVLWDEKEALENMPHVDDTWKLVQVKDDDGNPATYASKWAASDIDGRRDMLKEYTEMWADKTMVVIEITAENGEGGVAFDQLIKLDDSRLAAYAA
jgi:DNA invertase Pin-like site-specific DNA recombinase